MIFLESSLKDLFKMSKIKKKSYSPQRKGYINLILPASKNVYNYYSKKNQDPGYQGYFEEQLIKKFQKFMGGGYVDAVSSGTAAVFIAIRSLNLPSNSHILVSAIADPGTINAIILNGLKPKLVDTEIDSYNISIKKIKERYNKQVSAILAIHSSGQIVDMSPIIRFAKQKKIKVIEDCSQAHGGNIKKKKVGTFGDIAAFSCMYSKNLILNGTGGIIFTKNFKFYRNILLHGDRGKPVWKKSVNLKDPNQFKLPALNFQIDEISCAIGILNLKKLNYLIYKRRKILKILKKRVNSETKLCRINYKIEGSSPFFIPVIFDEKNSKITKEKFAFKLIKFGIQLNPSYKYLVQNWNFSKKYLADKYSCNNAKNLIKKSFNLAINEKYNIKDVSNIIRFIKSLENKYAKIVQ